MATTIGRLVANLGINSASFTQGLQQASRNLNSFGASVNRSFAGAERTFNNFSRSSKRIATDLGSLRSAFVALGGALATTQLTRSFDKLTEVNNKLKLATGSAQNAAMAMGQINEVSIRTQSSLSATADLYQKVAQNTKQLGLSADEVLKVTEAFGQTLRISGTSAEGASAAMLQFGQALAAGRLNGDEFRSISEQNSKFMDVLASSLGKTRGELKQMATDGRLTGDVLVNSLLKNFEALNREAQNIAPTFGKAFGLMKDQFDLGFFQSVKEEFAKITTAFTSPENLERIRVLGAFLGEWLLQMASYVKSFVGLVLDGWKAIGDGVNWLIGVFDFAAQSFVIAFEEIPNAIANKFIDMVNGTTGIVEGWINKIIDKLNIVTGVFGKTLEHVTLYRVDNVSMNFGGRMASAAEQTASTDYLRKGIFDPLEATYKNSYDRLKGTANGPQGSFSLPTAENVGSARAITKEQQKQIDNLNKIISDLKFRNEQFARTNEEQELYNQLRSAGVSIDSEAGQKIKSLVEEYNGLKSAQDAVEARQNKIKEATDRMTQAFGSAFEDAIMGAENFGDVLQSVLEQIERSLINLVVTQPLNDMMASIFADASSSGFFDGLFGGGKAFGGSVNATKAYLVGENGPEMFIPSSAGSIVPNNKMGGGGLGEVNIYIQNNNGSNVSAQSRESDNGGMDIMVMIDEAVAQNLSKRGTKTNSALMAQQQKSLIKR